METLYVTDNGIKVIKPGDAFRTAARAINAGVILVTSRELVAVLNRLDGIRGFQGAVKHLSGLKPVWLNRLYITPDAYNEAMSAYDSLPQVKRGIKAETIRVLYDKYAPVPNVVKQLTGASGVSVRKALINRSYDWHTRGIAESLAPCLVVRGIMVGLIAPSDLIALKGV